MDKKPTSTVVSERSFIALTESGWGKPGAREATKGAVAKVGLEVIEPQQQALEDDSGPWSDWFPPATGSSLLPEQQSSSPLASSTQESVFLLSQVQACFHGMIGGCRSQEGGMPLIVQEVESLGKCGGHGVQTKAW